MVFAQEGFGLVMAIVSIVTAVVAFAAIANAATDIAGIVRNWDTETVGGVIYQASSTCPSGYSLADAIEFPGTASVMGCACEPGSTMKYSNSAYSGTGAGTGTDPAVSSPSSACLTNQTSHAAYKCNNIPAQTGSISLSKYKGLYKCMKRGKADAVDQKYPGAGGVCEAGYYACGTGTAAEGVMCFPGTATGSASDCPVNWLGATGTLTTYGTTAGALTVGATGYTGVATTVGTASTIYGQQGKVAVVKSPYWLPLPLVDISMNFNRPCYGESEIPGKTNNDLDPASNSATGAPSIPANDGCSDG